MTMVCGLTILCVASDTDISAHTGGEGDGRFVLDGSQPSKVGMCSTMAGEGVVRERGRRAGGYLI